LPQSGNESIAIIIVMHCLTIIATNLGLRNRRMLFQFCI